MVWFFRGLLLDSRERKRRLRQAPLFLISIYHFRLSNPELPISSL